MLLLNYRIKGFHREKMKVKRQKAVSDENQEEAPCNINTIWLSFPHEGH